MKFVQCGLGFFVATTLVATLVAQTSDSAPVVPQRELARTVIDRGDSVVTFVRLTPPIAAPRREPPPAPPPRFLTAAELAVAERRAAKEYRVASFQAQVHLGKSLSTLLYWKDASGVTYRALSNVDFRLLASLSEMETDKFVFLWMPVVTVFDPALDGSGSVDLELVAANQLGLDPVKPDYAFVANSPKPVADDPMLAALDQAHALVAVDRKRLEAELRAVELAAARAAEEALRPKPTRMVTINYWPFVPSGR